MNRPPGLDLLRALAVVVATLPVVWPCAASGPSTGSGPAPTGDSAEIVLMPGDRISVAVFGQPELSATFQVDGAGAVDLPLIGMVVVGRLGLKQAEKLIEARLADGFIRRPVVNARMVETRPIYVLGDVRNPGAFPFRHGSSVHAAIAQAGGYGSSAQSSTVNMTTDFLLADERVALLEQQREQMLIRRARVQAQADEQETLEISAPSDGKLLSKDLNDTLANEREMLRVQATALAEELALLRQQRPRLELAHAAVVKQIEAEQSQFKLIEEQLKEQERLQGKGLARRSSQIALERERANLDATIARNRGELAQLTVMIGNSQIRVLDAQQAYRRRALVELEAVRTKLEEIEVALPVAREVLEARAQQAGRAAGASRARALYAVKLKRTVERAVKTTLVGEDEPVLPGDVIEVERVVANAPAGSGELQSSRASPGDGAPIQAKGSGQRRQHAR